MPSTRMNETASSREAFEREQSSRGIASLTLRLGGGEGQVDYEAPCIWLMLLWYDPKGANLEIIAGMTLMGQAKHSAKRLFPVQVFLDYVTLFMR